MGMAKSSKENKLNERSFTTTNQLNLVRFTFEKMLSKLSMLILLVILLRAIMIDGIDEVVGIIIMKGRMLLISRTKVKWLLLMMLVPSLLWVNRQKIRRNCIRLSFTGM